MDSNNNLLIREDGVFRNFSTKLGDSSRDATVNLSLTNLSMFTRDFLENIYTKDPFVSRACNLLPELALMKKGFLNFGDDKLQLERNKVVTDLFKSYNLNVYPAFLEAQIAANIHRGAAILMVIDDGNKNDFSKPVDVENIKRVKEFRIYDGWDIVPSYDDSSSGKLEPDFYILGASYGDPLIRQRRSSSLIRVHKSRILPFLAFDCHLTNYQGNVVSNGWKADTIIRKILDSVAQYQSAYQSTAHAIQSFEVTNLEIPNYVEKIMKDPSFAGKVQERAELLAKGYSLFRVLITDKDHERVSQITRNFSNIDSILESFADHMSASVGYPKSLLFGQYGTKLGSMGSEEQNAVTQLVKRVQSQCYQANIDKLCYYILKSKDYFDDYTPDWEWQWNSFKEESDKDIAEKREKEASIIEKYIQLNILTPEEVRNGLFASTGYKGLDHIRLGEEEIVDNEIEQLTQESEDG